MGVKRFDVCKLDGVEKTPQGFLRIPVFAARTGIQIYRNKDGTPFRELRLPEEVFSERTMSSLRGAPMTNNHPKQFVTPENARDLMIGFAADSVERVADQFLKTYVTVFDQKAIADIEAGKREVSMGYNVELDMTPGEYNGQKYDAIQRNILHNHIALVDRARGGRDVALHLDGDDAVLEIEDAVPGKDATREEKQAALEGRAKQFGLKAHPDANLSFPAGQPTELAQYADPVNLKFPMADLAQANNARTRFKQFAGELYQSDKEKTFVHERIVRRQLELGAKPAINENDPLDKLLPPSLIKKAEKAEKGDQMKIKIGDREFDVADDLGKAIQGLSDECGQWKKKAEDAEKASKKGDEAEKDLEKKQARIDHLEAELKRKNDGAQPTKEQLAAAVTARRRIEKVAEKTLKPEEFAKADSMDNVALMRAVIMAETPESKLDGKSDAYIEARFDQIAETTDVSADAARKAGDAVQKDRKDKADKAKADDPEKKRQEAQKADSDAWSKPTSTMRVRS